MNLDVLERAFVATTERVSYAASYARDLVQLPVADVQLLLAYVQFQSKSLKDLLNSLGEETIWNAHTTAMQEEILAFELDNA